MLTKWDTFLLIHVFKKKLSKIKKKKIYDTRTKKKKKSHHTCKACVTRLVCICVYMYAYTETTTKPSPIKE